MPSASWDDIQHRIFVDCMKEEVSNSKNISENGFTHKMEFNCQQICQHHEDIIQRGSVAKST